MYPLVNCDYIVQNQSNPNLILLDASLAQSAGGQTSDLQGKTIPGAVFFDLKHKFSDTSARFPNTFPSIEQFQSESRALGINNDSTIVVFDQRGMHSAPRVWWMFRVMGHQNVAVLDGGLPEWIAKGNKVAESYFEPASEGNFIARFDEDRVKGFDFVKSNEASKDCQIIDVRSASRFRGEVDEPRAGLRSGHIPGSVNLPYTELLIDGKFKSLSELKKVFDATELDNRPLTFSCGSGLTACIVLLAAELVLEHETSVYDGSWTEYGTLS